MSSGFHPKITLPTRITDTSNTLIDHILTNVYDDKHVSGILINKISDHQPINQNTLSDPNKITIHL